MATFTISEAAKLIGLDRKTLYKHIKKGRVSSGVAQSGQKYIEASELHRAYGNFEPPGDTGDKEAVATLETVVEELRQLRQAHTSMLEELQELRKEVVQGYLLPPQKKSKTPSRVNQKKVESFGDVLWNLKNRSVDEPNED